MASELRSAWDRPAGAALDLTRLEIERLYDRLDRLEAALKRYGTHDGAFAGFGHKSCSYLTDDTGRLVSGATCDCGFHAAINELAP